jgi:hypothetical protein
MVLTSFPRQENNIRGMATYICKRRKKIGESLAYLLFLLATCANVLVTDDNEQSWRGDILFLLLSMLQAGIRAPVTEHQRLQWFWARRAFAAHIRAGQAATRDHCAS